MIERTAGLLVLGGSLVCGTAAAASPPLPEAVSAALGLEGGTVFSLDAPPQLGAPFVALVPVEGCRTSCTWSPRRCAPTAIRCSSSGRAAS